jgi:hypothetical protein
MICNCFTELSSYCKGPDIKIETTVFVSIAVYITPLTVVVRLYVAAREL